MLIRVCVFSPFLVDVWWNKHPWCFFFYLFNIWIPKGTIQFAIENHSTSFYCAAKFSTSCDVIGAHARSHTHTHSLQITSAFSLHFRKNCFSKFNSYKMNDSCKFITKWCLVWSFFTFPMWMLVDINIEVCQLPSKQWKSVCSRMSWTRCAGYDFSTQMKMISMEKL